MKRIVMIIGAILGALAIFMGTAGIASASISQCSSGNACLWGENSYSGCFYQSSVDRTSLGNWQASCSTGVSANNGANSVANRGNSCNVGFYDGTSYTGAYIRFDRPVSGGTYQDPDLSNGGGSGGSTTANWDNRISSLNFCI